jgi:hypothetical protein
MAQETPSPQEQVRRLYEETESRMASAAEELVGTDSFGELLARLTENAMTVTRVGSDLLDQAVRNLRLASRQDLTRLARQIARTEDKLEMVLQEVERVHDRLDRIDATASGDGGSRQKSGSARGRSSSGAGSRGGTGNRSGSRSS